MARWKGRGSVGFDDLKIRDLSHLSGEWTPPIGIMGGPPAHELYADLVVFAGLQLYRDVRSRPVVVLQDGAQRRAFLTPSPELRSALDRFRMRRNLRPVPDAAIEEFVRIVRARTSDPDVEIPILKSPMVEQAPATQSPAPNDPITPRLKDIEEQIDSALRDLDQLDADRASESEPSPDSLEPVSPGTEEEGDEPPGPPLNPSISAARRVPVETGDRCARFVGVLRKLVQDGGWMGTTRELSRLTKEDALSVFDSVLRYRAELAENDILITNVEVEEGYRWLAVDRSKLRRSTDLTPSSEAVLLAR